MSAAHISSFVADAEIPPPRAEKPATRALLAGLRQDVRVGVDGVREGHDAWAQINAEQAQARAILIGYGIKVIDELNASFAEQNALSALTFKQARKLAKSALLKHGADLDQHSLVHGLLTLRNPVDAVSNLQQYTFAQMKARLLALNASPRVINALDTLAKVYNTSAKWLGLMGLVGLKLPAGASSGVALGSGSTASALKAAMPGLTAVGPAIGPILATAIATLKVLMVWPQSDKLYHLLDHNEISHSDIVRIVQAILQLKEGVCCAAVTKLHPAVDVLRATDQLTHAVVSETALPSSLVEAWHNAPDLTGEVGQIDKKKRVRELVAAVRQSEDEVKRRDALRVLTALFGGGVHAGIVDACACAVAGEGTAVKHVLALIA